MFLILASISFTLYTIEAGLFFYESISMKISSTKSKNTLSKNIEIYESSTGKKYDLRNVRQILKEENKKSTNTVLSLIPADYLDDNQSELFPIMSLSNRRTILCNEGGYTAIIDSDRYGFNNPDNEWDKKEINIY